jgi:hypothetical protein
MSPAHSDTLLEDVLLAFSVEPAQDRATLERYLRLYPQYAEDLIDLLSELRLPGRERADIAEDEAAFQRAWREFAGTTPRADAAGPSADPFTDFRGQGFVLLAQTLRIPRSVLIALRDRLVIASSIPAPFFDRLARAMQSTAQELLAYLDQPPVVARAANYKSDEKPEAPAKVSFEQLLDNSGVTADQKKDICASSD